MLFNSFPFLFVFLPLSLFVFYWLAGLGQRLALVWLFAASLVFYAWWNPAYLVLLLGSIVFNYAVGYSLVRGRGYERRWLLAGGIGANLLLLAYYKYAAFVLTSVGIDPGESSIVLPLAISFFTFTQITFLVDCHRNRVTDFDPLHYGLFVSYFPHLIAGPIVHHGDLVPQFSDARLGRLSWPDIASGLTLLLLGLFKKVILADQFGNWVNPAYAAIGNGIHLTVVEAHATALAFTLQIYFDYSAYCDMALGISVMLGIRLPLNFNSPLKAESILDFWRRWNMTLTRFLRSYIYRPLTAYFARRHAALGRKIASRALLRDPTGYAAIVVMPSMATMLACGVWHGAGWTFVVFGLMHGAFVVINQTWWLVVPPGHPSDQQRRRRLVGVMLTFSAVLLSLVLFRAPNLSDAGSMFASLAGAHGLRLPDEWLSHFGGWSSLLVPFRFAEARFFHADAMEIAWIALGLLVVWFLPNPYQWMSDSRLHLGIGSAPWRVATLSKWRVDWRPSRAWLAPMALIGAAAIVMMGGRVHEFIYFQF